MENAYGTIRVRKETVTEFKRIKLSVESSIGHELTNDEFVKMLIDLATNK